MNIKTEIKRISKLLNIKEPTIIFNDSLGFSYLDGIIYLKRITNRYKLLFLSIHELRHYYQDIYIKNNNDFISEKWKYEMDNYKMIDYLSYEIEIDAYSFSYLVLKNIYNIDYNLPVEIKNKVLDYISKNKYLYLLVLNIKV